MADVSDAGTAEVSVTIKTLTVGNKRMPLGIYRQLRCAPLVNPDGTFAGTPWGTVNAHPGAHQCHRGNIDTGRNVDSGQWWHVVWERDGLIFRDHITPGVRFDEFEPGDTGERYMDALILRFLIEDATRAGDAQDAASPLPPAPWRERTEWDREVLKYLRNVAEDGGCMLTKVDGMAVMLAASPVGYEAWDTKSRTELARKVHGYTGAGERVSEVLESTVPDVAKRIGELNQAVAVERARRGAVKAARAAVADLPQLFIGA